MGWPLKVRRAIFRIGVKAAVMTSSILRAQTKMNKKIRKSKARGGSSCFRMIQKIGRELKLLIKGGFLN